MEYFKIPRDVLVICLGKIDPCALRIDRERHAAEPEWEGHVTLEISNTTPLPARVYANEGVAQFLFLKGEQPCETSYADKGGEVYGAKGCYFAST